MSFRYDTGSSVRLRCLSVKDPWATEIAAGTKTIELRSYSVAPGPLGICSTASKGSSGRLLCIVDVVEVLPPNHPWLVSQGIRGLYGLVLENVRAGKVKPAVSGKQGLWYYDVTGDWAELVEGGSSTRARREPPPPPPSVPRRTDRRTRADKLRELANHPTTSKGERENALAELTRMGESTGASSRASFRPREEGGSFYTSHGGRYDRREDAEQAERASAAYRENMCKKAEREAAEQAERVAKAARKAEREAAEREARVLRYHEQEQKRAEERARKERAEAEAKDKERRQKEAREQEVKAWAEAEHQRLSEPHRRAEQQRAEAFAARSKELADRNALLEKSPFRIRGGGNPMDACPACSADAALALEGEFNENLSKRRYRCDHCGQGFDTIKAFGDVWMYRKREENQRRKYRY